MIPDVFTRPPHIPGGDVVLSGSKYIRIVVRRLTQQHLDHGSRILPPHLRCLEYGGSSRGKLADVRQELLPALAKGGFDGDLKIEPQLVLEAAAELLHEIFLERLPGDPGCQMPAFRRHADLCLLARTGDRDRAWRG